MINEDHSGPGFQKNKNLPKVSKVFRKKIFGKHPMFKNPCQKKVILDALSLLLKCLHY